LWIGQKQKANVQSKSTLIVFGVAVAIVIAAILAPQIGRPTLNAATINSGMGAVEINPAAAQSGRFVVERSYMIDLGNGVTITEWGILPWIFGAPGFLGRWRSTGMDESMAETQGGVAADREAFNSTANADAHE
jgi:hypothetical protein